MSLGRAVSFHFVLAAVLILGACQPAPSGRFAIYLLAQDFTPQDVAQMEVSSLPLQEQPLLTSDDVVLYRADTHEIQLSPSACQKLQHTFPPSIGVSGVPFAVCVGSERIYIGAFWTPLSSLSFDGVVIWQPCMTTQQQTMRIELGYPSQSFFTGRDPRGDPRVLGALRAAGKLR